ncbi:hypothetical protein EW146_g5206 [Bondarzewia mesenterica]|uniref:Uncharacterized protein n=1 Tax=Bondarzewia mesenterica TaxID=1095465 RepID=A0A4S4LUA5_9AGAM|nr:hypothetical protein EW146_g5206 [Bondarzewia mesenterica]
MCCPQSRLDSRLRQSHPDAGATAQSYTVTTQHLQSSRDINEAIHAHIVSPYKGSRLDHEFSPGATDAQVRGDVTELVQVRIERSIVVGNEDGSRVYPMGRDSYATPKVVWTQRQGA